MIQTDSSENESSIQALKKEANWINFIQIKPRKDPVFEKEMSKFVNHIF